MNDDVKAALARWRNKGGWSERSAAETLAAAYAAEHPEDDDEPVTVEWLRKITGKEGVVVDGDWRTSFTQDDGFASICFSHLAERQVAVEISNRGGFTGAFRWPTTRRQLRQLLAGLGVTLQPKEQEQ